MTITLNITEEQATIIRQALCRHSTLLLTKAFETEDELKKLGREGEEVWEYGQHDKVTELIEMIDKKGEEA